MVDASHMLTMLNWKRELPTLKMQRIITSWHSELLYTSIVLRGKPCVMHAWEPSILIPHINRHVGGERAETQHTEMMPQDMDGNVRYKEKRTNLSSSARKLLSAAHTHPRLG